MLEQLREKLQPLARLMAYPFLKIHPNVISLIGIFVFVPGTYFYAKGDSLLGSLFVLGALFDTIDGTVAKMTGRTSNFGGVLDATIDRFTEGLVLFGIGVGHLASWELIFTFFNLSICISYIKAKAEAASGTTKVGKNRFSVGITQRGDRIFIIFAASILNYLLTQDSNDIMQYAFIGLTVACAITLLWRGWAIWDVLKSID